MAQQNSRFDSLSDKAFNLLSGAGPNLKNSFGNAIKPFIQIGKRIRKFFFAVEALDFVK